MITFLKPRIIELCSGLLLLSLGALALYFSPPDRAALKEEIALRKGLISQKSPVPFSLDFAPLDLRVAQYKIEKLEKKYSYINGGLVNALGLFLTGLSLLVWLSVAFIRARVPAH